MFLNFIYNANRDSSITVLCVTLLGAFPLTFTFIFWNIYLVKCIQHNLKLHKNALNDSILDNTGFYKSQMYEYNTNYVKFWYMLIINSFELFGAVSYIIGYAITEFLWTHHEKFQHPDRFLYSNCSLGLYHNLPLELVIEVPVGLFCVALSESGILISMALSVCLMKYLESRFHYVKEPRNWIIKFLQMTSLIAFSFLVIGSIPQTVILHIIFEPVVQLVYYSNWIKQARRFYKVSLSRALEYKLTDKMRYKSCLKFSNHFRLVMLLYSIGIGCLLFCRTAMLSSILHFYHPTLRSLSLSLSIWY